jgi:hypothetical protein
MTPQIVGSKGNPHHIACLFYHSSGSFLAYRKDALVGINALLPDIDFQPFSDFLRKEHELLLLATLRISKDQLPFSNTTGCELEDFTDSHTTTGHELKDQAVPEF